MLNSALYNAMQRHQLVRCDSKKTRNRAFHKKTRNEMLNSALYCAMQRHQLVRCDSKKTRNRAFHKKTRNVK